MTYIPQSSHGGVPSGWNQTAATGEVIAKSTTDAGIPVHIEGIAGQDPAGDWTLLQVDDANAAIRLSVESNGSFTSNLSVADAGTFTIHDPGHPGALTLRDDLAGAHHTGIFFDQFTNAPDDTALSAGQFSLWFDDTNGAAKLMIKAKQADGTVKTGFVAVVT